MVVEVSFHKALVRTLRFATKVDQAMVKVVRIVVVKVSFSNLNENTKVCNQSGLGYCESEFYKNLRINTF
jgi:hypothetical protein